ncbi:protein disulfide isomerase-like 1-5 isoform X1 [Selaginella moellendorffii]|uniref:protein disulfide isomerase-like 1-5 isoform X1 n=1 Tax=Selaginella moellendorffii TaxID=88036 RepID=UPI000D1C2172|nr:protein disulfide isomerase-like 1-5 isoform X1 [Selaginella moellendorffii]|eukprot:XP_024539858.1 protein disulfide isomerase-like 1-5 isoform X1 [Selaginella moellendorffii]
MQLLRALWLLSVLLLLLLLPLGIHGLESVDRDALEEEDLDLEDEDLDTVEGPRSDVSMNFVADLTDESAPRVISSREYVLLLGYASWCSRSAALLPEFAAAALDLAGYGDGNGGILFAKIDAIANPKTAKLYNIKGFPTVLFLVNGSVQQAYTGGDSKEEIIDWVRKKTGSPASTVVSTKDAENFLANSSVIVAGFFDKFEGDDYKSFIEAAKQEVGTPFIQTNSLNVAQTFHSSIRKPPMVWIQKNEPEFYVPFDGTFSAQNLLDFVELNKFPVVVRMTSKNAARINSSPLKLQVLLFANEIDVKTVLPLFEEAAMAFKGKLIFLVVENSDMDFAMPFLSMYGVQPEKPVIVAFNYDNGQKFLLEEDINLQNILAFCQNLLSGDLTQHYKSEPIPSKDEGDLRIVVGKTFEKIVLDDSKDVFLQITSPWCGMCETANKTVAKLGTFFKGIPSLVIAQIDTSSNEHPKLEVTTYPAFLFYPAGHKNQPITAHAKTNLKGLVQFVKKHAAIPFAMPTTQHTKTKTSSTSSPPDRDEL